MLTIGTSTHASPLALGGTTFGWTSDEAISRQVLRYPAAVALAWLRGRPGVAAPIASARTPGQLASMTAFTRLQLTANQRSALDDVSARAPSA